MVTHPDPITIRLLVATDQVVPDTVAEGVFDGPVDPRWSTAFLADLFHV